MCRYRGLSTCGNHEVSKCGSYILLKSNESTVNDTAWLDLELRECLRWSNFSEPEPEPEPPPPPPAPVTKNASELLDYTLGRIATRALSTGAIALYFPFEDPPRSVLRPHCRAVPGEALAATPLRAMSRVAPFLPLAPPPTVQASAAAARLVPAAGVAAGDR